MSQRVVLAREAIECIVKGREELNAGWAIWRTREEWRARGVTDPWVAGWRLAYAFRQPDKHGR